MHEIVIGRLRRRKGVGLVPTAIRVINQVSSLGSRVTLNGSLREAQAAKQFRFA
jgi:hypothetical protein